MNKFVCWFVKVTSWFPFILVNRPKYYYEDKTVQSRKIKGKAIVMPNHYSVWDFATMMHTFPGRNLRAVVAEVIYKKGKAMSGLMNNLGSIRVDRNAYDFSFLEKGEEVLAKGGVMEIWPEARIPQKGEETPLSFKPSVTYLALSSGAPLIPVVTNGSFHSKERMRVMIGKPIDVRALYDENLSKKENVDLITQKLREKTIELKDELERRKNAKKRKRKKAQKEENGQLPV